MTQMMQIADAICAAMVKALPELKMNYIEPTSEGCRRPCMYVQAVEQSRKDASRATMRVVAKFSLMLLDVGGESGNPDTRCLLEMQRRTLGIFSSGYLMVGDRALRVAAQLGDYNPNACSAQVEVQFDYFDDRDEAAMILPLMEEITVSNASLS